MVQCCASVYEFVREFFFFFCFQLVLDVFFFIEVSLSLGAIGYVFFFLGFVDRGGVIIGREYKLNGLVERGQRCSTLYMFTLACTSC